MNIQGKLRGLLKMNLNSFGGIRIRIIENTTNMVIFYRKPKSKKKRIIKKWSKRPENWKPDLTAGYMIGDNLFVCHPVLAKKIREAMKDDKGYNVLESRLGDLLYG